MDSQLVKLWIQNEISKIKHRIHFYHEPEETGLAKIDVLERLYDFLELDKVTIKVTYHDKV
jgi:hypothetical protein